MRVMRDVRDATVSDGRRATISVNVNLERKCRLVTCVRENPKFPTMHFLLSHICLGFVWQEKPKPVTPTQQAQAKPSRAARTLERESASCCLSWRAGGARAPPAGDDG